MKNLKNFISHAAKKTNHNIYTNKVNLFNFTNVFLRNSSSDNFSKNPIKNIFYSYPIFSFAKKSNDKNDKKTKKEKEKETINKEYSGISVEELKSKYRTKTDNILTKFMEQLNEIRIQRSNPKILDSIQVKICSNLCIGSNKNKEE
jgi:hypothetical protein